MKRLVPVIAFLLLSACASAPTATPAPTSTGTATPIVTNNVTITATPIGTWNVTIVGAVYDSSLGKNKPISGARVTIQRYSIAINSETQGATTDAHGEYKIIMRMHDTDRVEISAQASGYMPITQVFVGLDFYPAGEHRQDILLIPIPTPTITPR